MKRSFEENIQDQGIAGALPREAVIARKMFKADRNTATSVCSGITWVSLVVMFTSSELVIVFEFNP